MLGAVVSRRHAMLGSQEVRRSRIFRHGHGRDIPVLHRDFGSLPSMMFASSKHSASPEEKHLASWICRQTSPGCKMPASAAAAGLQQQLLRDPLARSLAAAAAAATATRQFSAGASPQVAAAGVEVGQKFQKVRTFTQKDVDEFAVVSGDHNPLHQDCELAKSSRFGGPVVHGMLVGSLFTALIGTSVPGSIYLSQDFKFTSPVFPGDTVTAHVEVISVRSGKPGAMRPSKMSTRATKLGSNGEEVTVIEGHAMCMVP